MFDPSKLNLESEEKNPEITDTSEEKKDILWDINGEVHDEDWRVSEEGTEEVNGEVHGEDWRVSEEEPEEPISNWPLTPSNWQLDSNWPSKTIFDINIKSIDDVMALLIDNDYDFVTFEPDDTKVEVIFRKNSAIVETKYIKFATYSSILVKAKSITKLKLDEVKKSQEWKWEFQFNAKNFDVLSKTVPSAFWEKLYLKTKESKNQEVQIKKAKKSNISQIFAFLGTLLTVLLIIWWGFLSFIVLNANSIEDVRFFESLWINLSEINNFISNIVSITFSILIFIEVVFLVIFLFKFLLTKKEFRQKKIKYSIVSAFLFIITFSTASAWMFIDKKVRELPEWSIVALGEVQIYDNAKLKSNKFDKKWAFIKDTSNLIWPIEIEFDLSLLKEKENKKWLKIQKYIWNFWGEEVIETKPILIKKFDKKGIIEVKLNLQEVNSQWEITETEIKNIPTLNISYLVDIVDKPLQSGWKLVSFDAKNLEPLWKAEWYSMENLEEPIHKWYLYITWKPIYKETLIWLYLKKEWKDKILDRIFVINPEKDKKLDAEIIEKRDPINDLKYTFSAKNIKLDEWAWIVETFIWKIWKKEYTKAWDFKEAEKSSEIKHIFKNYWEKTIKLEIIDSAWKSKIIEKKLNVEKKMKLKTGLKIYSDNKEIKDFTYNRELWEYYINNLWIPSDLKIDAKNARLESILYALKKVSWDYDWDWNIDYVWKQWNHKLVKDGTRNIKVIYEFENRKIKWNIITIEENIYIEAVKKEAIVDFSIIKDGSYVPIRVWFDASKSIINNKNISKFVWDYWDGIKEERDAVVPWHMYTKEGNYDIKLTLITEDWLEYDVTKKLILKPTAQTVKIKTSMKEAPTFQEIDFISSDSSGDIVWYFWEFWDWESSTLANPSHFYKKPWEYKVKLTLDFRNRNVMENFVTIKITR